MGIEGLLDANAASRFQPNIPHLSTHRHTAARIYSMLCKRADCRGAHPLIDESIQMCSTAPTLMGALHELALHYVPQITQIVGHSCAYEHQHMLQFNVRTQPGTAVHKSTSMLQFNVHACAVQCACMCAPMQFNVRTLPGIAVPMSTSICCSSMRAPSQFNVHACAHPCSSMCAPSQAQLCP